MIDDDRRKRIVLAMVNPDKRRGRLDVITFTRKVKRCRDLTHFFEVAVEDDIRIVEQHLGLHRHVR